MKQLPQGGIIGKTAAAAKTIAALNIPFRAAYGAYFLILSAFPALLLILNSLRFTQLSVADLTGALENILPEALMDSVQELILSTYRNASSAVAGVSVLTLLWSSSKGVYGLLKGLNAVYGVEEDRGYVYIRGISVVYALLFLVVVVLTLVLHVFGNTLMELLRGIQNPVVMTLVDLIDLRGVLLLAIQVLLFSAIYMVLPNKLRRGLDGIFLGIFPVCDPLFQNLQYLRQCVFHSREHAVAVLLRQHSVLRGCAE